jgi:GTP cyclohydrolase I
MDADTTKPHSAVPSHMNNEQPTQKVPTEVRDQKERENLYNAIDKSNRGRQPVDFDGHNGSYFPAKAVAANMNGGSMQETHQIINGEIDVEGYMEGSKTPLKTSRAHSPYTQHPTIDFDGLSWPSKGTLARKEATEEEKKERLEKLSGAVRTMLECLGEDPDREGLRDTPDRYAKALLFFTKGYEENLRDIVNGAVFHEDHDELVIVKDIEIFSLCEHHLVPFTGKVGSAVRLTELDKDLTITDAYWLHPQPPRHRTIQARTYRRNVLPPPASSGTLNKTGRSCSFRNAAATRCRSCCRVESSLYGDAGRAEDGCNHHN